MAKDIEISVGSAIRDSDQITTRRQALKRMAAIGLAFYCPKIMFGCGGGGGGGDDNGPANIAGTWNCSELVDATDCGEGIYTEQVTYTVTQNGSNCTISSFKGVFNGKVDGKTVTWKCSYPEDGGTTFEDNSVVVRNNDVEGNCNWTWTDGTDSCAGETTITGTRVAAPYTSQYSSGYTSGYTSGYYSCYNSNYGSGYYSQYCSGSYYGGYYSYRCYYYYRSYGSYYNSCS